MRTVRVLEILNVNGYTPNIIERHSPHKTKTVGVVVFIDKEYGLLNLTSKTAKLFNPSNFHGVCYSIQEIKTYMKKQEAIDKLETWTSLVDMSMRGV